MLDISTWLENGAMGLVCGLFAWLIMRFIPSTQDKYLQSIKEQSEASAKQQENFHTTLDSQRSDFREELREARVTDSKSIEAINNLSQAVKENTTTLREKL